MEFIYVQERFRFKNKVKNVEGLAKKLGVSSSTVYNWISGKCVPPPAMREKIRAVEE